MLYAGCVFWQARIGTWTQEDGEKNVAHVKSFINDDKDLYAFHPEWLKRKCLLYRKIFDVNPVHAETVEGKSSEERSRNASALRRFQNRMRDEVNDCTFSPNADDVGGPL